MARADRRRGWMRTWALAVLAVLVASVMPAPVAIAQPASSIGLANYRDGVEDLGDGAWQVDFGYVIANLGTDTLDEIVLSNNFDATFAGATVESGPTPVGGGCSTEVASAPGHTLAAGESCTAIWRIIVRDVTSVIYMNTATINARNPAGDALIDISDDGFFPDANANGNANEPGENDPTPVRFRSYELGDTNCDGLVDIIDALLIAQFVAGIRTNTISCDEPVGPLEIHLSFAEVSGDGVVDIIDALVLAQCDAGVVNNFCPAPLAN